MYLRQKGQFYHGPLFWRCQLLYLHEKFFATTEVKKVHICKKKNRKVAKLGETCHANEPCRWGFSKGQFALREILFVLQKNLSTRNPFQCERFVWPTKIFASATNLQRYRQLALEVYNFLSDEKIYCSLTDTLQLVIIFRNWYQAKWYYVRVFSLWTC